jgi:DNA topoisomerase-1
MSSTQASLEDKFAAKSGVESVARGARARWWRRRGTKRGGFRYEDALGKRIMDEAALERIRSLAIPPAWKEVRISPSPRQRLQAIGLDTGGRVQRIYHPAFAAKQARRKYAKIERFGEQLKRLRRRTNEDIAREGLPRERVLAVVVRLINDLYFRVGSEESVARYRTYGITTLRNRHLEFKHGGRLIFTFVGKHHIKHRRILVDEELAALLQDIQSLRGKRLFQYWDEATRRPVAIKPRDVNEYIKLATAPEFSAKDFRTWGGTLLCAVELAELGKPADEREAKRNLLHAIKAVAQHLGNTPTVCRSSYIHPAVIERYCQGITLDEFRPQKTRRIQRQLPEHDPEEIALLKLLGAPGSNKSNSATTK